MSNDNLTLTPEDAALILSALAGAWNIGARSERWVELFKSIQACAALVPPNERALQIAEDNAVFELAECDSQRNLRANIADAIMSACDEETEELRVRLKHSKAVFDLQQAILRKLEKSEQAFRDRAVAAEREPAQSKFAAEAERLADRMLDELQRENAELSRDIDRTNEIAMDLMRARDDLRESLKPFADEWESVPVKHREAYLLDGHATWPWYKRAAEAYRSSAPGTSDPVSLEDRFAEWVRTRIGSEHMNPRERAMRLLEEAVELAQSEGVTRSQVDAQVCHVFCRPAGDPRQEAGGVAVCLLGWCAAHGVKLRDVMMRELERIEAKPLSGSLERKRDSDLITLVDDA